jgi:hypothetical protein
MSVAQTLFDIYVELSEVIDSEPRNWRRMWLTDLQLSLQGVIQDVSEMERFRDEVVEEARAKEYAEERERIITGSMALLDLQRIMAERN